MKATTKKRVLMILSSALSHEGAAKYNGVMRYLCTRRPDWSVRIGVNKFGRPPDAAVIRQEFDYGVDGLILYCPADSDAQRIVREYDVPLVTMDMRRQLLRAPDGIRDANVSADEGALVRRAARYLTRDSGYASYAYVDLPPIAHWSNDRENAFRAELAARGLPCVGIHSFAEMERLYDLPRPTAILAANDWIANAVAQRAAIMGLRIPAEIALLGVDNEPTICDHADPPISSVAFDFEACGYKAAALMTALLKGRQISPFSTYGIRGVCERTSTAVSSPVASLIRKVDTYIRQNIHRPFNVTDLARALKVSRRLLDLRYRQMRRTSVLKAIHEARLERAKELLSSTHYAIGQIAQQCGVTDGKRLSALFRKRFGLSMREYRKRAYSAHVD